MRTRIGYEPLIPGTNLSRIEYLRLLDSYYQDELYLDPNFRHAPMKGLITDGILNVSQIASVMRCRRFEVKALARQLGLDPLRVGRVRGAFDPRCIGTLIAVNELHREGRELPETVLQYLERTISGSLFQVLTGVNRVTLYRASHR